MAIRSRNKVSPNFNMSSMTDIVFLLLIFFMLTSTLVSPNALKMLLPSSSSSSTPIKKSTYVAVTADLKYYLNKKQVDFTSLEPLLLSELQGSEDPTIILQAEKTLPIEEAVKVMDIANRNRIKLVLATQRAK